MHRGWRGLHAIGTERRPGLKGGHLAGVCVPARLDPVAGLEPTCLRALKAARARRQREAEARRDARKVVRRRLVVCPGHGVHRHEAQAAVYTPQPLGADAGACQTVHLCSRARRSARQEACMALHGGAKGRLRVTVDYFHTVPVAYSRDYAEDCKRCVFVAHGADSVPAAETPRSSWWPQRAPAARSPPPCGRPARVGSRAAWA